MNNHPIALLPLPIENWNNSLAEVAADMGGMPLNVHKLMAHNPALLEAWWNFRNYSVTGGTLGNRLGELVILRVGIQLAAWYEWGSHVDRSLKCGLSLEEINAVSRRKIEPTWAQKEAAILDAVDELVEDKRISPATLEKLSQHLSTPQIIDIIAIHGMYLTLGCMINTWGLELDPTVDARIREHTTRDSFDDMARLFHRK